MHFRCAGFNANRSFYAESFQAAAARVANRQAINLGGKRAGAWTLRLDSTSTDYTRWHYSSTLAIPTKQPGEARVIAQSYFTVVAAEGAR